MDIESQNNIVTENENKIVTEEVTVESEKPDLNKKQKKTKADNKFPMLCCPFINYTPLAIEDFAYEPTSQLLAVAREESVIDIYHIPSWGLRQKIKSDKDCPIKKIAWVNGELQSKYLLVAHLNCIISIYDLYSCKPVVTKTVNGNAIWDIAINSANEIAVAGDDGSVNIYKYDGEDDFYISRSLRQFNERAISLSFDYENDKILYVGYDKGMIRKHDSKGGAIPVTMSLNNKEIVWRVLSVSDDNLVASSSDGIIYFFETKFGTLLSQIKTHEADIVCLTANSRKDIVYATGLDSKIVSLERVSGQTENGGGRSSWVISSSDRGQSHDVKALTLLNDSTLISGGLTTDICIYNLQEGRFIDRKMSLLNNTKDIKLRHITSLPTQSSSAVSASKSIILFAKNFSLEIWHYDFNKMEYTYLLEIKTKASPIIAFAMNASGKNIAYSTKEDTTLFKFDSKKLQLEKISQFQPTCNLFFNNAGTKLFMISLDSRIMAYDIHKAKTAELLSIPTRSTGLIHDVHVARPKDIFALGSKITNEIFIFDSNNNKLTAIPPLVGKSHYTSFAFSSNENLIITYENNKFVEYDWKNESLTEWFLENINNFPQTYLKKYNRIIGVLPHPSDPKKFTLYTNYYFITIHLDEPIPPKCTVIKPSTDKKLKKLTPKNFRITYREKAIAGIHPLGDGKLLCLDFDFKEFVKYLPGAINAKKYGL